MIQGLCKNLSKVSASYDLTKHSSVKHINGDLRALVIVHSGVKEIDKVQLKEAAENGKLLVDTNYRYLSNGVRTFGGLYLGARAGAICFDPSFPSAFHAVNQVPGLAVAAMLMVGLTLRSDEK